MAQTNGIVSGGSDAEFMAFVGEHAAIVSVAAQGVSLEREIFELLSELMSELAKLLGDLSHTLSDDGLPLRGPIELLDKEVGKVERLVGQVQSKGPLLVLLSSKQVAQQAQDAARAMGRSLIQLSMTAGQSQGAAKSRELGKRMQSTQCQASPASSAALEKIEEGLPERVDDPLFAKEVVEQAKAALSLPGGSTDFDAQVEALQGAKEEAEVAGNSKEAARLKQVVLLLRKGLADGANSSVGAGTPVPVTPDASSGAGGGAEKEFEQRTRRNSSNSSSNIPFGVTLLPPLQSFLCPVSQEVMEDPVKIASGQVLDRSSVEQWLEGGHKTCPVTGAELASLDMQPDAALKQVIDDWRERNTAIQIQAVRPKLQATREEDIEAGLQEVFRLCQERSLNRYWIAAEGLMPLVVNVLKSSSRNLRRKALATLTNLAVNNDENKEAMVEAGSIQLAVRSLSRDTGESRQAVALLLELSRNPKVCEDIGRAQGAILLLVTLLSSDNPKAAHDAGLVLDQLATNDQNVVQMAEATHFKPLAERLIDGSDMTRTVMASAVSRMALTDQSKAILVQVGAIPPLVGMISGGKLEAKAAALGALQNLSSLAANRDHMIAAGVLPPLLQLLFSVTSVVSNLKEGAAAALANLAVASSSAQTDRAKAGGEEGDEAGTMLESEETLYQLLSLLNLTTAVVQGHLLRTLQGLAEAPGAAEVRKRMRAGGAITVLLPFLEAADQADAMKVVVGLLSSRGPKVAARSAMLEAVTAALGLSSPGIAYIVDWVECSAGRACVRGVFSCSTKLQATVAAAGAIPPLVRLLESGTSRAKKYAAICLGNMAESSVVLSVPSKPAGKSCCFSPPPEPTCPVHGGLCDVPTSFCLIEAEAVAPLVGTVVDDDPETAEAAIGAISTLLADQCRWENGLEQINDAGGFMGVVHQLTVGTERAKERGVWMLEKMFRIEKYKFEYGAKAQGALIELTQHGSNDTKPVAAKILSHLEILHNQSSYF
eukprot:jgi/Mesen1/5355/ME000267S04504